MNIRTIILIIAALIVFGIGATMVAAQGSPDGSSDGIVMQEENPDDGESGDSTEDGDADEGDAEEGTDDEGDSEESTDDEAVEDEVPADDETPAGDEMPPGGMDIILDMPVLSTNEQNIQDALSGTRDYEVSYNGSLSRQELTPPELKALDVTYAGEESPIASQTQLLNDLDMLVILSDRYQKVEDEFGATVEEDFDEESDRTLNYYQPRGDPFVITDLIPDELRPEMEGTGLDGAVDPDLLEELYWANYQAQLRLVPIYIIGTMEAGPNKICMFMIGGLNRSFTIQQGQSLNFGYFTLYCSQISEDFVVFVLRAGSASVTRTFHVRR